MLIPATVLFLGLLDASEVIAEHQLRRQVAEFLLPRGHWADLTEQAMRDDPTLPKSFACWMTTEGYDRFLDAQADFLRERCRLDAPGAVFILTGGRAGTRPAQPALRSMHWRCREVPRLVSDLAQSYAFDRELWGKD